MFPRPIAFGLWSARKDGLSFSLRRRNEPLVEIYLSKIAADIFWKPHRSYRVNIRHIKEVVPWFKSTYMLKMSDKKQTQIPVSRTQIKRMRELFKL